MSVDDNSDRYFLFARFSRCNLGAWKLFRFGFANTVGLQNQTFWKSRGVPIRSMANSLWQLTPVVIPRSPRIRAGGGVIEDSQDGLVLSQPQQNSLIPLRHSFLVLKAISSQVLIFASQNNCSSEFSFSKKMFVLMIHHFLKLKALALILRSSLYNVTVPLMVKAAAYFFKFCSSYFNHF